ncbi:MAG: hypothetical protein LKI21_07685 [Bifidobacterium crudilactis]|nr:hypothetical protein [Bifidobacterium crudilactis]
MSESIGLRDALMASALGVTRNVQRLLDLSVAPHDGQNASFMAKGLDGAFHRGADKPALARAIDTVRHMIELTDDPGLLVQPHAVNSYLNWYAGQPDAARRSALSSLLLSNDNTLSRIVLTALEKGIHPCAARNSLHSEVLADQSAEKTSGDGFALNDLLKHSEALAVYSVRGDSGSERFTAIMPSGSGDINAALVDTATRIVRDRESRGLDDAAGILRDVMGLHAQDSPVGDEATVVSPVSTPLGGFCLPGVVTMFSQIEPEPAQVPCDPADPLNDLSGPAAGLSL